MQGSDGTIAECSFSAIIDALPGLVWTTQNDGQSDFVNRGWNDYTGLGPDASFGHGWQRALHPADLPSFQAAWETIRESGVTCEFDARLRRFDGGYRWFAFRPARFPGNESDVSRWCWLANDIDENPSTDGRMQRLLDTLPIQVAFLNLSGTSEYSNRKTLNDYGMTLEQLAQWTTSGAIHVDDHARVTEKITRLMTSGEMFDDQVRMHYKDGSYRWMHCLCVPFRDARGEVVRYVTCQLDIDDLKRAEALLAAEVSVLEMVARGQPLSQVLEALCRHIEELRAGCECCILVVGPDGERLEIGAAPSLAEDYRAFLRGKPVFGGRDPYSQAIEEGTPVISDDLIGDARWVGSQWPGLMAGFGYASCWTMPILSAGDRPSGILAVHRRERHGPPRQERELIDRFAKIAGITIDRARADAALRAREKELREAYAQLSEGQRLSRTGTFTADLQQDSHRWSEEFYRIFEIDRATSPSVRWVRERVYPGDLELFDKEIQWGIDGRDADFTFRIVTPTNGLKYLRGVARVMEHVDGRPIFMGTVQDITDSKLAEAALRASEAELRQTNMQLMDAHRMSRTGSFTWDVAADEHLWTEEIYRLFGFDHAGPLRAVAILNAIHPEDRPAFENLLDRANAAGDFDLGFRIVGRSGPAKYARAVGRRARQGANAPVLTGVLQDVTASKEAEDALNRARSELEHVARVAALGALTASIAHEVNQPLSGIMTNAGTCLRMLATDPPNLQGAAETARRTIRDANRAAEVIKRLRALFAKKAPTVELLDLNEVARELMTLSSGELQRRNVIVQTAFSENLPAVAGDRIQLQQVILNLLMNGADAMAGIEDRPKTLLVLTERGDDGSVRLIVQDTGVGIEPHAAERLFDPFYSTKEHGMGVGLSISRAIIESHEGRLWAAANTGPGATFGFWIPSTYPVASG
jgi:PAS domain S-box-containing protein